LWRPEEPAQPSVLQREACRGGSAEPMPVVTLGVAYAAYGNALLSQIRCALSDSMGYQQGFCLYILFLRHRKIIRKREFQKSFKALFLPFCIEDLGTKWKPFLSHCCVPRSGD